MSGRLPRLAGVVATVDTAGQGYFIAVTVTIPTSASGVIVSAINQVRAFQFVLPFRAKVSKVATEVLTAGASGKKFGLGLYDKDKNLLLKTAALDANSQTVQSDTLATPVILEPGVYWFAQTSDDVATAFRVVLVGTAFNAPNANIARTGTAANNASAGVLPATLGTITGDTTRNPAIVMFEP